MTMKKSNIRREDTIVVISGNDKGARGRVLRVMPKDDQVVVESVNIRKKHQRAMQAGRGQVQAGIIQFEAPVHVSNVMLVCPQCDQATRVAHRREDGRSVRVCKKCGKDID
jgi:large subunit ribosomal protein L24